MSETNDTNEDVTGLKNKIAELHGLIKAEKARADKAEREKDEAAETAASANSTELEKMHKRAEKAERDLDAANKRADASDKSLRATRADHAISKAISEANVDAKHVRAATAILKLDMNFDDEGNALIEGKSVPDFAKSYFAKDGLSYVRAADNSGGLSQGNTSTTKPPLMTKETFNYTDFGNLMASNPAEANALADQLGRPDLKSK